MILNSPSIYKLGGGGGGYKDLGEIVDQSTLTIPNNSYVTIDNYSQSSITVDVETADGEITNAVIIVNNELDSTISVTVNGSAIAINSGSSNSLLEDTQYQITVLGNAYTVTALTQPAIILPDSYKQVQYHELTGNGYPGWNINSSQWSFHLNAISFKDYMECKFELNFNNTGGEIVFKFIGMNIWGSTCGISYRDAVNLYGYPFYGEWQYNGVIYTPGYQKNIPTYDSLISRSTTKCRWWADSLNNTYQTANGPTNNIPQACGNQAQLESFPELFIAQFYEGANLSMIAGTKLYYVKVKDKMNLIPVVRINDGKNGWYDTVTGNFAYPDQTGGDYAYTPGPDV